MAAPLQDNEKDALIARLQNENRSLIQEQSMLGLNYNHKKEDGIEARHLANNDIPVFTKVPELSTMKTDEDIDHLLIEGDNLPALIALLPTYRGKVNVIYIDPPYNTGNNDFVYNDRYVDSEDGFKHSKWLSFMKPRLQLAHEMLSDDGVIFVSIDDHEQAYLKVMMDEVFGEQNFIANIKWRKTVKPSGNTSSRKLIDRQHEYVLCFAKSIDSVSFNPYYFSQKELKAKGYTHKDEYFDERGYYKLTPLWHSNSGSSFAYQESLDYPVKAPDGSTITIWRNDEKPRNRWMRYTWGKKAFDNGNSLGFIEFVKEKNGKWSLYRKMYTKVKFDPKNGSVVNLPSNVAYTDYYDESTTDTSAALNNALGIDFNFTKPIELIQHLLRIASSKSSTVLDFFAGSGTTGQAVAELNKEDGGHRKCILITNNFEQDGAPNGIARDITSVRMKRVLTGENWADGKKHEPLPGNLIYYRLDWQPMSTSLTNLPGMLPLSTFLGSLSINQDANRLMNVPDNMPTLSRLVHDGHAALLTNENNKHTVLALDADTSDDFDTLDTVKAELESSNLLEGLDFAMESGFDTDTYMDSGVFDHEFTFPVPDIIQIQATVKMLKKDGVISINDNQEDHTHMNNDGNEENR